MWWKGYTFFVLIAGFRLCHSSGNRPPAAVERENVLREFPDEYVDFEKNTVQIEELINPHGVQNPMEASEYLQQRWEDEREKDLEYDGVHSGRRTRRQVQTSSLLNSVSQECDGITLRWTKPNIPFSSHSPNGNPKFSHYNIYREKSHFVSVAGLKPIASGRDYQVLQNILTRKWTDKFPPTATSLFYAVTVVDSKGNETQNVVSKQITFYGSFEKVGGLPTRVIPRYLKGDVLHHTLAYNSFQNEYMVAFDLDVNKDGRPDQVYALRLNSQGQSVDQKILNVTVKVTTTEQGKPSIAFNPSTKQYLVVFQLTAPHLFRGNSMIFGQRVKAGKTDGFGKPFVILKAAVGRTFHSAKEAKLIYNSASGGFAMSVILVLPPKYVFAVFLKADGDTIVSIKGLSAREVFEANVFMDPKAGQIYFFFQTAPSKPKVLQDRPNMSYPYIIVLVKANATGGLLPLNQPPAILYLAGVTTVRHANIAGYFNENDGWLTIFWNNEEYGKKMINSSKIFGVPGILELERNTNICPTHSSVQNSASCFLPDNNGHILLWEQGSAIGGFLVKHDTFKPVLGKQQQPQIFYNQRDKQALAVWKQNSGGNFVLFVMNVRPGSQVTCRVPCKSTDRCVMNDVCAPKNQEKTPSFCLDPGVPTHGGRSPSPRSGGKYKVGDRVIFFCNPGFVHLGPKQRECLSTANWTGIDIQCQASFCLDPGVPTHGGRNPSPGSGGKYKFGDIVIFTCNPGFVHLGSNQRECLSTANWTGTNTQCKARPVFTSVPSNRTVESGTTVALKCSAAISPGVKAKIEWYKNGKKISSTNGRYRHIIPLDLFLIINTVDADTARYTCVASNDVIKDQTSMFLLVNSYVVKGCGIATFKRGSRITGGRPAAHGSIPWQVLLWKKQERKPFCGGSLLNSRLVITAAHCFPYPQLSNIQVILGEFDWRKREKTEQKHDVDHIMIHPKYNSHSLDSDIALIKLKKRAIMTDYIKPVCLPNSGSDLALLKPNNVARVSGWGTDKKSRVVTKLRQVEIPITSHATCRKSHSKYFVTPNMFCAGSANGKKDACDGDSGGPLTIDNKKTGRTVLIGIVSWGPHGKCGVKNKPGVYTKVQNYLDWIKSYIKQFSEVKLKSSKNLLVFTLVPSNKTVNSNTAVVLQCSAKTSGGIKAKIHWYKNGKMIPPSTNGRYSQMTPSGFFSIAKTVDGDTGTYTCVATIDGAGEIRTSMFLLVKGATRPGCGRAKFKSRVRSIGSRRAVRGSIPWQVLLWEKRTKKPFCGGSLLNSRWVVTAAQCFIHRQLSQVKVILGEFDRKKTEKTEQKFNISKVIEHPMYNLSTYNADIALIKLKKRANMTDYVKPLCLPTLKSDLALLKPSNVGRVSGWGPKKCRPNTYRFVRRLHEMTVPIVSRSTCQKSFPKYPVTSNMFCARRADQGRAGDPLTIENKKSGRTVLIGLVSWGSPRCVGKNLPTAFTKVQNFVSWIENNIKRNS